MRYYPLHYACSYNQSEKVVLALLDHFPDAATVSNQFGSYPLHLACYYNQSENVVLTLLNTCSMAVKVKHFLGQMLWTLPKNRVD
jgi:ankyrin repeat protein